MLEEPSPSEIPINTGLSTPKVKVEGFLTKANGIDEKFVDEIGDYLKNRVLVQKVGEIFG